MVKNVSAEPFIDEVTISVAAGDGGAGCTHFRREAYVPRGGPDGGDGGRGGDIVLRATTHLNTLNPFRRRRTIAAENGRPGAKQRQTGKSGESLLIEVPIGTMVIDDETGLLVADLDAHGAEAVVATGGDGGRGNWQFKSSRNRAPRKSTPGHPGDQKVLRLELRLLADVALIGMPNAGKSSLIRSLTSARPKIGDYPFTTLVPNLGVVDDGRGDGFVIADIPGLIEGASTGAGLGHTFLRHVARSHVLVHVIDVATGDPDAVAHTHELILTELERSPVEIESPVAIIALNKSDLLEPEQHDKLRSDIASRYGIDTVLTSAATNAGIDDLKGILADHVSRVHVPTRDDSDLPSAAERIWDSA